MTNAATVNRDVINFQNGAAYEFALKYPTGKVISNGRVMFSTTDGEVFFIAQDEADQIYDLQLRPQERFRLLKSRAGITVERIPHTQSRSNGQNGQQPEPTPQRVPPVAASASGELLQAQPSRIQYNSLSAIMASSYISAIDALTVAKDYADKHGVPFKISSMELRSCAHCIFIAASRGVNTWQR